MQGLQIEAETAGKYRIEIHGGDGLPYPDATTVVDYRVEDGLLKLIYENSERYVNLDRIVGFEVTVAE